MCPSVCFVRPIKNLVFWWPSDRTIKFMSMGFFHGMMRVRSTVLLGMLIFLASPVQFFVFSPQTSAAMSMRLTAPTAPLLPAQISHYSGICLKNPLLAMFCAIFYPLD